jgi:hypothetical protein
LVQPQRMKQTHQSIVRNPIDNKQYLFTLPSSLACSLEQHSHRYRQQARVYACLPVITANTDNFLANRSEIFQCTRHIVDKRFVFLLLDI